MTTKTTQDRLYPGMLCQGIEFFNSQEGVKVIASGSVLNFKDIPMPIYQVLKENLQMDAPALEILMQWHPDSEAKRLEQFASCRLGGLDFTSDIIHKKQLTAFILED